MARAPERWPVIRAALSEAGRGSVAALAGLVPRSFSPMPDRLLFAPQDLRTSDPTAAEAIYAGTFVFAGRLVESRGQSPFVLAAPSEAWAEALYGFGWLRHLRAADTALARDRARALVTDAVGPRRYDLDRGIGRRTTVLARRLISLLAHSPLVLSGADHALYIAYLKAIGRHGAALQRDMSRAPVPGDRLVAAIGLCFAGLCCQGLESQLRRGTRTLSAELDAQILPDGGPIGRNPSTLVDLLLDLLPLRLLYGSRGLDAPAALERAIDRMLPMLRFFRHGSGDLALFNGMGRTPLDHLATIQSVDRVMGAPVMHALPSGYDRLDCAGTLVILDAGAAPPLRSAASAHAGCLAFELSSGLDRIVVNCGVPPAGMAGAGAARHTAAHSTLTLDGTSSATILEDDGPGWAESFLLRRLGPVMVRGPRRVTSERSGGDGQDLLVDARHDGYEERFGVVHARRLRVAADGGILDGIDVLKAGPSRPPGPLRATARFHLHPAVAATAEEAGGITLALPGGERWLFVTLGGTAVLAESISFAVPEGRRPARQIVVEITLPEGTDEVSLGWSFRRRVTVAHA